MENTSNFEYHDALKTATPISPEATVKFKLAGHIKTKRIEAFQI